MFHVKQASLCTATINNQATPRTLAARRGHASSVEEQHISSAVTRQTKANQRHKFNQPLKPRDRPTAASYSASEGLAIRWCEHACSATIYQAHDPLPPRHDPLIPSSCDIRFLGSTHERRKMTERQRTCLTLRIGYASARHQLLMHVLEPSRNPACSGVHIHKHPPGSCT